MVLNIKLQTIIFVVFLGFFGGVNHVFAAQPPDFSAINNVQQRKSAFINYIQGISGKLSAETLQERKQVISYHKKYKNNQLNSTDQQKVQEIAKKYRIKKFSINKKQDWQELLNRVDVVPNSLIIAQAANESAWGTSRFVKMGNNFFGQWCFKKGCGVVPKNRTAGSAHEVRYFNTAAESVRSYLMNLNTHKAYQALRNLRAQNRKEKKSLSGDYLAGGLINYSQLREKYVKYIRSLIHYNKLEKFD